MPTLSKLVSATQTHDARTRNGAVTHSTSQSQLVDLFFIAGTLIWQDPKNYMQKWYWAYWEDKELAMRLLFWMRDVRWWAWVRDAFNFIYNGLTPEEKRHFAHYIPEYGRWKDVFELAEQDFMPFKWLILDYLSNWPKQSDFWLFCKWFPRKWELFNKVRKEFKVKPWALRQLIVKGSNTVEQKMSAKEWDKILYEHVPSKAFAKYQKAFERHDSERFSKFVDKTPEKIKATTLFPADIYKGFTKWNDDKIIEAQWKNLPNYIESNKTFLPVVDVSGSMSWGYGSWNTGITPIMNSVSLWVYLAERNKSIFKDAFITFSANPKMHYIPWDSVINKFNYIAHDPDQWLNTNIQAVFDLVLNSAVDNNLTQEDLPDYIIILSDMEFDDPDIGGKYTNFEAIKRKFKTYSSIHQYEMPKLIFWNLNGRIGNVPVTINDNGVALVSGYSPAIMKSVLTSKVVTPYDVMKETLDLPRYKSIV